MGQYNRVFCHLSLSPSLGEESSLLVSVERVPGRVYPTPSVPLGRYYEVERWQDAMAGKDERGRIRLP